MEKGSSSEGLKGKGKGKAKDEIQENREPSSIAGRSLDFVKQQYMANLAIKDEFSEPLEDIGVEGKEEGSSSKDITSSAKQKEGGALENTKRIIKDLREELKNLDGKDAAKRAREEWLLYDSEDSEQ
jgi:hypothetical protein